MAIANVVQRGTYLYIYDEKGNKTGQIGLAGREFQGFTSNNVNVKQGSFVYIYDAKGNKTGMMQV